MNLFKTETEDALIKLVNHQNQLIEAYRERVKTQEETIHLLKQINEVNELEIKHLKQDLSRLEKK
jgi:hypothetical protein